MSGNHNSGRRKTRHTTAELRGILEPQDTAGLPSKQAELVTKTALMVEQRISEMMKLQYVEPMPETPEAIYESAAAFLTYPEIAARHGLTLQELKKWHPIIERARANKVHWVNTKKAEGVADGNPAMIIHVDKVDHGRSEKLVHQFQGIQENEFEGWTDEQLLNGVQTVQFTEQKPPKNARKEADGDS